MTQESNEKNNVLQEIWQNGQLAWRLYTDSRVSFLLKAMVPVLGLAYFIMPIDLLPDFIPVLGQLDEVAIILLLVRLFIALAPPDVVAEYKGGATGSQAGPSAQKTTNDAGANRNGAAPKTARDDVIDADYRVVNDA
jgi:uncharacterized membrane protein YkvA (DUF1232 family)